MKRLWLPLLCLLLLCGCGFLRENSYTVVEPHDEDYGISVDSDIMTVSSYLSLKNAILNLVEDGSSQGVIRAESYSGDLADDLSHAVQEVSKGTPLGAYAVTSMTYDYSKIVSYYEIHINTTFCRTQEEIQNITYVTDMDALREKLREAVAEFSPKLVLQVGAYDALDLEAELQELYEDRPELELEHPVTSLELYPETGTQRILEITFTYAYSAETLLAYQAELLDKVELLASIYGCTSMDMVNAGRLFTRLGRNAVLEQLTEGSSSFSGSAYGVLVAEKGNCHGFAQAYRLLLDRCGIPCTLVSGQWNGVDHEWCMAKLDGNWYYIDPSLSAGGYDFFLMGDEELESYGYYIWNASDYPSVELPPYWKPDLE